MTWVEFMNALYKTKSRTKPLPWDVLLKKRDTFYINSGEKPHTGRSFHRDHTLLDQQPRVSTWSPQLLLFKTLQQKGLPAEKKPQMVTEHSCLKACMAPCLAPVIVWWSCQCLWSIYKWVVGGGVCSTFSDLQKYQCLLTFFMFWTSQVKKKKKKKLMFGGGFYGTD